MNPADCPQCQGYLHIRTENNKFRRCECYYGVVLKARMGPLYPLASIEDSTLVAHISKDIALVGPTDQWEPFVAHILRHTPERFKHRILSLQKVMQIHYSERHGPDEETPDDLDAIPWLIVSLNGVPDYRKMGELAVLLRERRRMLRRPTWFIVPGGPSRLKAQFSMSPAVSELIGGLPIFKLDGSTVVPYTEGLAGARQHTVPSQVAGPGPKAFSRQAFRIGGTRPTEVMQNPFPDVGEALVPPGRVEATSRAPEPPTEEEDVEERRGVGKRKSQLRGSGLNSKRFGDRS